MRSRDDGGSRNGQVERVLQILRDLTRSTGVERTELAERYGACERTIRRDLEALQAIGLPVVEERDGKRKRWRIAYHDHLERLGNLLDASHYLALRMAMGQAAALSNDSSTFAALEDLSDKVEQVLGKGERERLRAIERCFLSLERAAYRTSAPDVLWPLVTAISEGRLCQVSYQSAADAPPGKRFVVLPLRLFVHSGAPYLLCSSKRHGTILTLNLNRLRALETLEERGEPPAGFDPERWAGAAFGIFGGGPTETFRLRFAPGIAPFIREREWHPTQALRELEGGAVELSFTCARSYEVSAFVASWHSHVEVLEPESLREEMRELGEWLASTYGKPRAARAGAKTAAGKRGRRRADARSR
ncbi:MAG TPA: hypothetical protein DFS52_05210 [Myxococcales bacterium]|nr:hypothetical protein [Myxococcales bacterium]